MLQVIIQEYEETDWSQVRDIILQAENFGRPFLESERQRITLYKQFPDFGKVIIARIPNKEKIVGYATFEFRWRALILTALITHYNYLRKGIGNQMMDWIKKTGEEHPETNVIRTDTGDFMDYAQKFYLSCGFQISGFVSHDMSWFNHQVHFSYPLKGVDKKQLY